MKRTRFRPKGPIRSIAHQTAAAWNRKYKPGQRVRYWTAPKETTPPKGIDRVQGTAFVDSGTAVVLLHGIPGLFPVVRIEAVED